MGIEQIIPGESEYEKLLKEIRELQARIVELTAIRDDLLYHICPSLRAIYDEKIGSIEREIPAAKLYLREKQRILEILQAQLNRQEIVSVKDAEEKAGEEFRRFEEDLHKKAEEAEQFNNRWKESQWRKHEEEAKRDSRGSGDRGGSTEEKAGNDSADNRSSKGGSSDTVLVIMACQNGPVQVIMATILTMTTGMRTILAKQQKSRGIRSKR